MSRQFDNMAAFGELVNALRGGGNKGNVFPESDVEDLRNGARQIPNEVTDARRAGQTVRFVQGGPMRSWYWELPSGKKIPHGE